MLRNLVTRQLCTHRIVIFWPNNLHAPADHKTKVLVHFASSFIRDQVGETRSHAEISIIRVHVSRCEVLPPANEVCEGNVFTGVCLSTGGCIYPGRSLPGGSLSGRPPYGNESTVCILLECILVSACD